MQPSSALLSGWLEPYAHNQGTKYQHAGVMAWPHTQTYTGCAYSGNTVRSRGLFFSVVQSWQPLQLSYYRNNSSAHMQGKTNVKKVLRGLPSLSASGGKREKHILHLNLFMAPEGPLLPDEGLFSPLVPPLLIDMWNPSLRYSKGRPCVCLKGAHC